MKRALPARGRFSSRACAMAVDVRLIVTDAPPITLAVAKSLDNLLYPELPVLIPDAVFHEAAAAAGKLGAREILDWYRAHMNAIRIEPTEIFQNEMTLREIAGHRPSRDLGERAALEVIRDQPMNADERALLLSDERDAERLAIVDPEKLVLLTTWDYPRQLEEVGGGCRYRGRPRGGPQSADARLVESA